MSWRSTGIIWICAVLTITCGWLLGGADTGGSLESGPQRVLEPDNFSIDDVDEIVLDRGNRGRMRFERTGEGWIQTEPFTVGADGYAIRQLMVAAADLEYSRRIARDELGSETSLEQLGLDPPSASLEMISGDKTYRIDVGRRTVAGRGWIRMPDSDDLLVVDDALHERAVEEDPRNWRSRQLFRGDGEVDSIVIENGKTITSLERDGRLWSMSTPVSTRGDMDGIDRLLAIIDRIEHDGFIIDTPDDLSKFGLESPVATLKVRRGENVEMVLVGSTSGLVSSDRYAMMDGVPTVIRLTEATLRGLLPDTVSLIEPTATGVRAADVKTIEIVHREAGSLLLVRSLDGWSIQRRTAGADPVAGWADTESVNALLKTLCETRSPEIMVRDFPRELAIANVTLLGYSGEPLDTIQIAREPDQGRWAFENGEEVLRIFPGSTPVQIDPIEWRVRLAKPE